MFYNGLVYKNVLYSRLKLIVLFNLSNCFTSYTLISYLTEDKTNIRQVASRHPTTLTDL